MDDKHIVGFDTGAVNKLADDPDRAILLPKIRSGFQVRLSATSASELIATADALRRSKLLTLSKELMRSGDCIHSAYQLLQMLIRDSEVSLPFDWRLVDIRFQEAEDVLRNGVAFDDSESQSLRDENRQAKDKFEDFHRRFNSLYAQALAEQGATRPASLGESVERLRKSGSFDKMASALYAYVSERDPRNDPPLAAVVENFLRACPPFLALLLGLCAARYTRNLKAPQRPSIRAGALDTSMAVCLPYSSIFVTSDAAMERCFKEVGHLARLPVEVVSYDWFRQRVM
ncbi:MAG TPA: hypothetical protein VNJ52_00060 [Patescibacteria group bacterium]|nr:hypothetical protein [Patescibacteria group bacterium]